MRLGWNHCGYDSISDPDLEGEVMLQPRSTERERGRLLGPVALPRRISSGDPSVITSGSGRGGVYYTHDNNVSDHRHVARSRRLQSSEQGERSRNMSPNSSGLAEEDADVPPFWSGSGAWRARFCSEGSYCPQADVSRTTSAEAAGNHHQSLWRRLRWGPTSSATPDLENTSQRKDPGGSERRGTGGRTVQDKAQELLHLGFDPDFDTSRQHLVKLFNTLDKNGSGTISYEAMRMGLANLGTYSDLNYLMTKAEMDKSKEITLDGFVATVQEHAAKMFAAKRDVPVSCFCYDYSAADVAFRWVKTGQHSPPSPAVTIRDLLNEPQGDKKGQVRWICVSGSDPSLVIRMASRYGIHPLQVEDCLNPKERLKVDAYRAPVKTARESSSSSSPSLVEFVSRSDDRDDGGAHTTPSSPYQGKTDEDTLPRGVDDVANEVGKAGRVSTMACPSPSPSEAKSMFCQTWPPVGPTPEETTGGDSLFPLPLRSVAGEERMATANDDILHVLLGKMSIKQPTPGRPSNFQTEQVSIFLVGDHTVLFIERTPSDVSDRISNRMLYAGSKLRLNNARYLVYSLMDSIVDGVFPIMQHFQKWLVVLQGKLLSDEMGPSLEVVRAIQQISRDMHMITFYLRPMKMVAAQLITDLPGSDLDLKRHLEDLRDHLLMLEEQALRMSTWSRSLNKDWVNEQQHRMNQVVYILTMVTSAFMPAQFLTGVFGMNFKFMPELNWRYSYASFWVLVALLAFTSYTVYKRHKWL